MPLNLPNRITVGRIVCIPFFILLILNYKSSIRAGRPQELFRWGATVVYLAAILSDALDGYLARSRGQISKLGKALDALADKALLLSALIPLARPFGIGMGLPVWFVLLVISRDVVLVGGALLIHHVTGDVVVHPRLSGKAATFFQMGVIAWILLDLSTAVFPAVFGLATIFTSVSAVQYALDGAAQLEKSTTGVQR
jgi:CDP-diacylglycerol--glycerol-3-phosphate 3-phosphatidyltransferase